MCLHVVDRVKEKMFVSPCFEQNQRGNVCVSMLWTESKRKCLCLHVVDRIKEEPSADIQFPVLDENDEVTEADLLQLEGKCGSILQSEGKW